MKKYLFPSILAALSVAAFFGDLLTYKAHADSGGSFCVSIAILIFCLIRLVTKVWQREKAGALAYLLVVLLSIPLIYWESKIPLCPMCDGVTAEDLGFLSRWIPTGP